MKEVDLSCYNNSWFKKQTKGIKSIIWYFINAFFINCYWNPSSTSRIFLLRLFGAKIGKRVFIKPSVNIKYPWNLSIGDNTWIGENVWIDNLVPISLGKNVCISQGAMLLCGNHNFKTSTFDLIVKPITIENGAWIGAKSIVCPGVTVHTHSVLTVGSIATKNLEPYYIYKGNPASKISQREIIN